MLHVINKEAAGIAVLLPETWMTSRDPCDGMAAGLAADLWVVNSRFSVSGGFFLVFTSSAAERHIPQF